MLQKVFLLLCLMTLISSLVKAEEPAQSKEKATSLIKASIEALGGQAYLSVKSEKSQGLVTPYRETVPDSNDIQPDKRGTQSFIDYILLPNKERVEFKGQGRLFIQSNADKHNWTYDSDSELLRDQTQAQKDRFLRTLRYQVDKILRGGWNDPSIEITYIPRQELWPRQYGEGVKLTYLDKEEAELFFDPQTKLPIALRFPKDTYEGQRVKAENRFFKYIDINSLKTPYVVDLFENGKQVLRINYDTREFNIPISDKLFVKPNNIKAIK
ncbi:MAG: hypothetical protein HY819_04560 [Acidobacteria bacterium]|nr:hypothetical protein [Acidobacteriota bacterium]